MYNSTPNSHQISVILCNYACYFLPMTSDMPILKLKRTEDLSLKETGVSPESDRNSLFFVESPVLSNTSDDYIPEGTKVFPNFQPSVHPVFNRWCLIKS